MKKKSEDLNGASSIESHQTNSIEKLIISDWPQSAKEVDFIVTNINRSSRFRIIFSSSSW